MTEPMTDELAEIRARYARAASARSGSIERYEARRALEELAEGDIEQLIDALDAALAEIERLKAQIAIMTPRREPVRKDSWQSFGKIDAEVLL